MKNLKDMHQAYKDYTDNVFVLAAVALAFFCIFVSAGYFFSRKVAISIVFGMFGVSVALKEFILWRRKWIIKTIERQFMEIMQIVLSSVSAGVSIESAFSELCNGPLQSRRDLTLIKKEIQTIVYGMNINYSFYELLDDFAERTGIGDIVNLSKALTIAGTKGGNVTCIIRNALANMRIKSEADREIEQTLSLPKYNHRIMIIMPFALILLLRSISKEYLDILYESNIGGAVVSGCAVILLFAWVLGNRICDVKI